MVSSLGRKLSMFANTSGAICHQEHENAFCSRLTLSDMQTVSVAISHTLTNTNMLSIFSLAEGLRWPSRVSGWREQGYCGSERAWQRLCSGQPAWHLHQCALLHRVDSQGYEILPQPSDHLKTQQGLQHNAEDWSKLKSLCSRNSSGSPKTPGVDETDPGKSS